MSDKATPRPWHNDAYGAIAGQDGHCIALAANDKGKHFHNAELIVRAVNQHDALMEVAKAARIYLQEIDNPVPDVAMRSAYRKQLRAALDKVKGE